LLRGYFVLPNPLRYACGFGDSIKKAVSFSPTAFLGIFYLFQFINNLKTMGGWPWIKGATKQDPKAGAIN
jgi:hypothetical protein